MEHNKIMKEFIGRKGSQQNPANYASRLEGENESWEEIINFATIQKDRIEIKQLLKSLTKIDQKNEK